MQSNIKDEIKCLAFIFQLNVSLPAAVESAHRYLLSSVWCPTAHSKSFLVNVLLINMTAIIQSDL